mgnify:CR=1 FL=1|jgi:hypothetical protein|tara:strand:- start:126 stop:356 length:231 start_codon:yes stop_codon:yes gene_type:complete
MGMKNVRQFGQLKVGQNIKFKYTPELSKTMTLKGKLKDIVIAGQGTKNERLEYIEVESSNGLTHFITFDEIQDLEV